MQFRKGFSIALGFVIEILTLLSIDLFVFFCRFDVYVLQTKVTYAAELLY